MVVLMASGDVNAASATCTATGGNQYTSPAAIMPQRHTSTMSFVLSGSRFQRQFIVYFLHVPSTRMTESTCGGSTEASEDCGTRSTDAGLLNVGMGY